jgi:hypothetical protein
MKRQQLTVALAALLGGGAIYLSLATEDSRAIPLPETADARLQALEPDAADARGSLRLPVGGPPKARSDSQPQQTVEPAVPADVAPQATQNGSETLAFTLKLLDEVRTLEKEGFDKLSLPELEDLRERMGDANGKRGAEIFDTRMGMGLFETRRMRVDAEYSHTALEKEYGCQLGTSSGPSEADGTYRLDIVQYPETEYPEIYELSKYLGIVGRLAHEKRKVARGTGG